MDKKITYDSAGVSIDRGNDLVDRIKKITSRRRNNPDVLSGIGGFAGLFRVPTGYREPVLVSSTDGVGTKLKLAFEMNMHDTIGYDLVAMSVNDILVTGARPLFFLDYFATSKLDVDTAEKVVKGIFEACDSCDVELSGGETAELPGFYTEGEYDLAGFAVGVVERTEIANVNSVKEGDLVYALPSTGLHSNGYSLARKVYQEVLKWDLKDTFPGSELTVGEILLAPTRLYVKPVLELLRLRLVKTMVHVTGGGLIENPPRSLPAGLGMDIKSDSWPIPAVFTEMQKAGIDQEEMYRTFNMGLGFLMTVSPEKAAMLEGTLQKMAEPFYKVGTVTKRSDNKKDTRFI